MREDAASGVIEMAKVYTVVAYRSVVSPEALAAYSALAGPAIRQGGGRFIARGTPLKTLEAGLDQRVTVIEWDDLSHAIAVWESKSYLSALAALGNAAERDIRIVQAAE
jgi:uncharacterized protein (DUF1330 family)